jgi:hypothetical protein
MASGKPKSSSIGMNTIFVKKELPSSLEETYNELLNYTDILEPLRHHFFLERERYQVKL